MCLSARVSYSEGVIFLCCVEPFTFCWVNVLASFMSRTCITVFCCTWSAASVFSLLMMSPVSAKDLERLHLWRFFFESGQKLLVLSFLHSLATCTKSLHVLSNHVSRQQVTWHKKRVHVRCFRIKNPRLQVFNGGINWQVQPNAGTQVRPSFHPHHTIIFDLHITIISFLKDCKFSKRTHGKSNPHLHLRHSWNLSTAPGFAEITARWPDFSRFGCGETNMIRNVLM